MCEELANQLKGRLIKINSQLIITYFRCHLVIIGLKGNPLRTHQLALFLSGRPEHGLESGKGQWQKSCHPSVGDSSAHTMAFRLPAAVC